MKMEVIKYFLMLSSLFCFTNWPYEGVKNTIYSKGFEMYNILFVEKQFERHKKGQHFGFI